VLSDAFGEADVGAGGEVEFAATSVFLLQEVKELAVVGQVGSVERNVRCNEGFESGFAAQQSSGKPEEGLGVISSQCQKRVNQRVGFDQGAIEIDAERLGADGGRIWLGEDLGQRVPRVVAPAERT
jgi:hypothetical protein